jgi:riboflavin kinase/FMN adenylyltransferase
MQETNTAVVVGNFDGIHLGHIHLLNKLKEEAKKRNLIPLVITFDPHPAEVLKNRKDFCKLSTGREKKELIETKFGIKTEVINFTEEFSQIPAKNFIKDWLLKMFGAKLILVGYDWHFGRNAEGDYKLVEEICRSEHCEVIKVEPLTLGEKIVSSSLIREFLKNGELKKAELHLGHPYWIRRKVVKGKGLASKIGFPTLNIEEDIESLCLPNGVYAVYCEGLPAIANLGYAPTLKGERRLLEVHVLDTVFYHPEPKVVFKKFIRPEKGFKTIYELLERIKKDVELVKRYFLID